MVAVVEYKTKRRNEWNIIYESLIFVNRNPGVPKTRLMYAENLSGTMFKQIKDKLVKEGLIEMKMIKKRKSAMYITDKGLQTIKLGREFLTLLGCSTPAGVI